MVVDQLSTQCFCARSTCTLMPLFTPLTRAQMALQHSQLGLSLRTTAVAFGVCEKTVRRWLARAKEGGFPTRLVDRSSVPHHQPRKTSPQLEAKILALRRQRRSYAQIMMV